MPQIQQGIRVVLPSSMSGCVAVITTAGVTVSTSLIDGDFVIDGPTLIELRDGDVRSFGVRFVDQEGDYVETKFVLTAGEESFKVLVR